jgi:hypothetical protein
MAPIRTRMKVGLLVAAVAVIRSPAHAQAQATVTASCNYTRCYGITNGTNCMFSPADMGFTAILNVQAATVQMNNTSYPLSVSGNEVSWQTVGVNGVGTSRFQIDRSTLGTTRINWGDGYHDTNSGTCNLVKPQF